MYPKCLLLFPSKLLTYLVLCTVHHWLCDTLYTCNFQEFPIKSIKYVCPFSFDPDRPMQRVHFIKHTERENNQKHLKILNWTSQNKLNVQCLNWPCSIELFRWKMPNADIIESPWAMWVFVYTLWALELIFKWKKSFH